VDENKRYGLRQDMVFDPTGNVKKRKKQKNQNFFVEKFILTSILLEFEGVVDRHVIEGRVKKRFVQSKTINYYRRRNLVLRACLVFILFFLCIFPFPFPFPFRFFFCERTILYS